MVGSIVEIISIVSIAILINYVLFSFALNGFLNVSCPVLTAEYNETLNESFDVGGVTYTQDISWRDILSLATGRCEGLSIWIILIVEIPILLGLIYAGRLFVGLT